MQLKDLISKLDGPKRSLARVALDTAGITRVTASNRAVVNEILESLGEVAPLAEPAAGITGDGNEARCPVCNGPMIPVMLAGNRKVVYCKVHYLALPVAMQ